MQSTPYSRLLRDLARDGIEDRVLAAMAAVPRHEFVPEGERNLAYHDTALPIGEGQTISQPYIVGFMTGKLELQPTDRVLEIGTGSGYQAAVLSKLVAEVYSIEILEDLAAQALARLQHLDITNVHTRLGDGALGWPEAAPFDAIMLTCAPDHVPAKLVDQLKEGGRLILPVGPRTDQQKLCLLRKLHGEALSEAVLAVRFVPMVGAVQNEDDRAMG